MLYGFSEHHLLLSEMEMETLGLLGDKGQSDLCKLETPELVMTLVLGKVVATVWSEGSCKETLKNSEF